MAAITVTASKVAICDPDQAEIFPAVPAVALTAGLTTYITSAGKVNKASAAAATTLGTTGLVLEKAGVRQGVSILRRGKVMGFDLSGLAYMAKVYFSDTAGVLADAAGTVSAVAGRVVPLSDSDATKVLYFEPDWRA